MKRARGTKTGTNTDAPDDGPETAADDASGPSRVASSSGSSRAPSSSGSGPRVWVGRLSAKRDEIRRRPAAYRVYRLLVGMVGVGIVAGGIALLPLPGPGWVIVFLGLHVLATEFAWARALERFARDQVAAWTAWLKRQSLLLRVGLGAVMIVVVLAIFYGLFALSGVPGWIPDSWIPDLPGLR